jgi:hypothetical protein
MRRRMLLSRMWTLGTLVSVLAITPASVARASGADPTADPTASPHVVAVASESNIADLEIRIIGTTVQNGTSKTAAAIVTNNGPSTARGIVMVETGWVDSETMDPERASFCPHPGGATLAAKAAWGPSVISQLDEQCTLADLTPGHSLRLETTIAPWASGLGTFGQITLAVSHDGSDPVPVNNSATANLQISAQGQDVYLRAWDVPVDTTGRVGTVIPGSTTTLQYEVGSRGAVPVAGFTVSIRLPQYVTFARSIDACQYNAQRSAATCTYPNLPLVPASMGSDPVRGLYSALRLSIPLTVSAVAPAPARLTGGNATVEPIGAPTASNLAARTSGALPDGITAVTADRDATDNSDRFTVFLARAPVTLPATGSPAAMIAAIGTAIVAIGALLLLLARLLLLHARRGAAHLDGR